MSPLDSAVREGSDYHRWHVTFRLVVLGTKNHEEQYSLDDILYAMRLDKSFPSQVALGKGILPHHKTP